MTLLPEDGGPPIPFRFTTVDDLLLDCHAMLAQRRPASAIATFLRAGYVAIAAQDAAAAAAADLRQEREARRAAALARLDLAREVAKRSPAPAARVSRMSAFGYRRPRFGGVIAGVRERTYP